RGRLEGFLPEGRRSLGEIGGIVHCAGRMARVAPFPAKHPDEVHAVLEPKVDGLEVLAELCERDRPSFFVLFSSVSALWPGLMAGVVEYSAANAFLDFFAGHRARTGHPEVRSVAWPEWRGIGMVEEIRPEARLPSIEVEEGLAVLDSVIAGAM